MPSTTVGPRQRARWHDAYDTQMALWRFYRSETGKQFMGYLFDETTAELEEDTREMLLGLYQAESGRLLDCDPIYCSAEMCELAEAAAESFEPEPLLETDLVTTRGFMYFAKPFEIPDRFDAPMTIAAASWARMITHKDPEVVRKLNEHIRERAEDFGSGRELEIEALTAGSRVVGISLTLYQVNGAGVGPPLTPAHITPWFFGMTFEGNETDERGKPTGAGWWWKIMQTTFRLMQQKIAIRHRLRPGRDSRREAAKLRFPDEQTVVVVRLRREEGDQKEPSGEEANYSHRFIVNGHWRNQWYASDQIHRQIWISPYVKGDAGLPLIVKPRRVFQWDR